MIAVLVICLIVLFILLPIALKQQSSHKNQIEGTISNQQLTNQKITEALLSSNFTPTKTFYITDFTTINSTKEQKQFISVDSSNKKIALVDYKKGNHYILNFSDIISYEIYDNEYKVNTGSAVGNQYGGVIFGTSNSLCHELALLIRIKNFDCPQIRYDFFVSTKVRAGINRKSDKYAVIVSSLQEIVSFLEIVIAENNAK